MSRHGFPTASWRRCKAVINLFAGRYSCLARRFLAGHSYNAAAASKFRPRFLLFLTQIPFSSDKALRYFIDNCSVVFLPLSIDRADDLFLVDHEFAVDDAADDLDLEIHIGLEDTRKLFADRIMSLKNDF